MFIISLEYKVPLEKVDEVREEHLRFLKKYYDKSVFFVSGPKVPRIGGVILADRVQREELEAIIKEDPFYRYHIAEYEITEFKVTMDLFKKTK